MLGWFNDALEQLTKSRFGSDFWQSVVETVSTRTHGQLEVPSHGFVKLESYDDLLTMEMLSVIAEASSLTLDALLQAFGEYFSTYLRSQGYDALLRCQGVCLKDWLNNINAVHQHLQSTFPHAMSLPFFYCEEPSRTAQDQEEEEPIQLILHYHSKRAAIFAPFAQGFIQEVAASQFQVSIQMQTLGLQGVDGEECTSWKVTAEDPEQQWKLTRKQASASAVNNAATETGKTIRCPFSGLVMSMPSPPSSSSSSSSVSSSCPAQKTQATSTAAQKQDSSTALDPSPKRRRVSVDNESANCVLNAISSTGPSICSDTAEASGIGLSPTVTKSLFPYHIMISADFTMVQVGSKLPGLLRRCHNQDNTELDLMGQNVTHLFQMAKRPMQRNWNANQWHWLLSMCDTQTFDLVPVTATACPTGAYNATTTHEHRMAFKTTAVQVEVSLVMLILTPDVHHLQDLATWGTIPTTTTPTIKEEEEEGEKSKQKEIETPTEEDEGETLTTMTTTAATTTATNQPLTLCDFSIHSAHRDLIMAREHLTSQIHSSLRMEKLSQCLDRERTLLESLLPRHAAEGLRAGKAVKPRLHPNVTLFFSDICGFTALSQQLQPWQVIAMLNQLYSVMDYLAGKFQLYKIETIGDAYVCCSGLPQADEDHAKNVANFAIAVQHCCRQVLSPVDHSTPIQLRVGVHTGECASGVVGTTNPRYCVFGDTVNTTSRHESSGEAGKVHCSITTQAELTSRYPELFGLEKRGQVYMKGKGEQTTYWLTSQDNNPLVNTAALEELDVEVRTILAKSQFQNEKDFEKQVVRRNGGCQVTREVRTLRKFRRILSQTISTSSANLVEVSSTSSGSDTSSSEDGERVAKQDDVDLGPLVRRGSSLQLLEASADMFKQQNSHSRAVAGPEENTTSLKRKAISGQEGMELGTAWDSILQKQ